MTRTAARGLAVQLSFMLAQNRQEGALDAFLDPEYFASLSGEDGVPAEYPDERQLDYIRRLVTGVAERQDELDGFIDRYSRGWSSTRISRTAAAVLRCALFELLYMDDVPDSAAINEAVELAKTYDDGETVAFINGILGGFMRGEKGYVPDMPELPDTPDIQADVADENADEPMAVADPEPVAEDAVADENADEPMAVVDGE